MDAQQALADLAEISSQIRAAALIDQEGQVGASTLPEDRARDFARVVGELLASAENVRASGGESLTQLEVATGEGSVFVVRDGGRTIAATTSPEPTVGLVFYDLKSCLRSVSGDEEEAEKPKRGKKAAEKKAAGEDAA